MKIIGMIPARGGSTRYYNKPLADICGKPMVYWVWKHSKEVEMFDEVYIATDSEQIEAVAKSFGAEVIMTSFECETATERLYEVSQKINADMYVMINGDEPLVQARDIVKCIPEEMNYTYQKFVGVGAFTKKALEYYHDTPRGPVEKVEENDSLRFIENRKDCYYINAHCKTLSVDTPKDRVQVERYMKEHHLDR